MMEMRVRVRYLGLIRNKLGKMDEEFDLKKGTSLSDLLNSLTKKYGDSLKNVLNFKGESILDPTFIVTVNGVSCRLDTRLKEGDTIALMTLISGG
jgi:MoaD family protein